MAKLTPQELATKWAQRLSAATPEIQAGINRITVSPTTQAAAKQQKMLQNLTAAVQSGKWAKGLNNVTLDQWKKAAIEKGLPRIAQGANAATGKMADFAAKLIPYQESLQQKVANMPDLSLADSISRMTTWVTEMSKFKK